MVLDQCFLCLADSFFHCVELLRHIYAGSLRFDHGDDTAQVSLRAVQPLDDVGVTFVYVRLM